MHTKQFRNEIKAMICKTEHKRSRAFCRMHDQVSIDLDEPQSLSDIHVTPKQDKQASRSNSLTFLDQKFLKKAKKNFITKGMIYE